MTIPSVLVPEMASWFWRLEGDNLGTAPWLPCDQLINTSQLKHATKAWSSSTIKEVREGLGHHNAPQILLQLEVHERSQSFRFRERLLVILAPCMASSGPPTSHLRIHFGGGFGYCLTFAS